MKVTSNIMSPTIRKRLAFESECLSRMFWKRFMTHVGGQTRPLIPKPALAVPMKLAKNKAA